VRIVDKIVPKGLEYRCRRRQYVRMRDNRILNAIALKPFEIIMARAHQPVRYTQYSLFVHTGLQHGAVTVCTESSEMVQEPCYLSPFRLQSKRLMTSIPLGRIRIVARNRRALETIALVMPSSIGVVQAPVLHANPTKLVPTLATTVPKDTFRRQKKHRCCKNATLTSCDCILRLFQSVPNTGDTSSCSKLPK
jgi:hypothetical protein